MKTSYKWKVSFLILYILINLVVINFSYAQPVDSVNALLVAKNFYISSLSQGNQMHLKSISIQNLEFYLAHKENDNLGKNNLKNTSQTLPLYYIFNVKGKNGFVIVSGDQRIPAILGYSFTGEFSENDQPPAYRAWMNSYKEQIKYAIQNNLTAKPETSEEWTKYSSTVELKNYGPPNAVAPLITTLWSQGCYYNDLCPVDSRSGQCNHVWAGCSAVAMAQIMKYWNYPSTNNPIPGYTDAINTDENGNPIANSSYGWMPNLGATTYNWAQMPDALSSSSSSTARNAVSTLVYHCGVSIQMNYGPYGSGAWPTNDVFVNYFKYSSGIQFLNKQNYSTTDWSNLLRTELDNSRPIIYYGFNNVSDNNWGSGHAFVCDGYQNTDYFHFNWGWGGNSNGYYYLNDLTPSIYVFNYHQYAHVGIAPEEDNTNLIAHYPLLSDGIDITGQNSPMTLRNAPFQNGGVYCNGIYDLDFPTTGCKVMTPSRINGFNINSFTISMDFMITQLFSSTTYSHPVFIGGTSSRWIGFCHYYEAGLEKVSFLTNNSDYTKTQTSISLNQWHNAKIVYKDNVVYVYMDDILIATKSAILNSSGDYNVGATNYSNATVFKGYLKNLKVYSTPSSAVVTLTVNAAAVNASIGSAGENDWYKFQTGTAGTYTMQTYGSTDMYMYLYQSDQTTLIEEDDDDGDGNNSLITRSLSANTWYYVKTKAYSASATGNYSIDVKTAATNIVTLTVNAAAVNASIGSAGENDWYKFQTGTAGTYTMQTYGSTDMYMYLYQSDQTTLIEEDDDDGDGNNSLISRSLSANTWYYVKTKAYSASATGNYSIDVKTAATNIVTLTVNAAAVNASIGSAGENDWYKFQTGTAGTYTMQTYGSTDMYMYLYQSDQTTLIEEDDDDGDGNNSLITRSLSANTWYYVKTKAYSASATGNYSIDVKTAATNIVTLTVNAAAVNASIGSAGENDWYKFQTGTAGTYTMQTYGSTDMYMYLYQSDQTTLIEEDDDDGDGNNSLITRSLSANTWYYVKTKAYSASATGNYSIDVKTAATNIVTLTVNAAAVNASIGSAGENDWYKFQTGTAGTYTMQTYGSTDMYMYLYQSDQTTLIEEDDDDGDGNNSLISRSLSANTWYYVKVRAYSASATGNYSIDVKTEATNVVTLTVFAAAVNASISSAGENDWYKFQTVNGGPWVYIVQTQGSLDTYMYLYDSDQTTLLDSDDDDGEGLNAMISRQDYPFGWYYVKVKAYSSTATGSYSIGLTGQWPDVAAIKEIKDNANAIGEDSLVHKNISLNVFPNPTSDMICVIMNGNSDNILRLEIISPTGQQVFMKPLETNQQINEIIDVQDFPSGLYFVRIVTSGKIITSKFIKN